MVQVKNHGRPWPCEREGPAAKRWEGFSFQQAPSEHYTW